MTREKQPKNVYLVCLNYYGSGPEWDVVGVYETERAAEERIEELRNQNPRAIRNGTLWVEPWELGRRYPV